MYFFVGSYIYIYICIWFVCTISAHICSFGSSTKFYTQCGFPTVACMSLSSHGFTIGIGCVRKWIRYKIYHWPCPQTKRYYHLFSEWRLCARAPVAAKYPC